MRLMHNVVHARLFHRHHQNFVLDMRQLNEWVQLRDFYATETDWHSLWERFSVYKEATVLETYFLAARRFFDQPLPTGIRPSRTANLFEKGMCVAVKGPVLGAILNTDRYLFYPKKLLSPSFFRHKIKEVMAGQAWW
jgi:hypothetical protein